MEKHWCGDLQLLREPAGGEPLTVSARGQRVEVVEELQHLIFAAAFGAFVGTLLDTALASIPYLTVR